jgi:hypothetical protein
VAGVIGAAWFFGVLYAVDRALARWGSAAIRQRPRPGLRVTLVFGSVVATYVAVGLVAQRVASWSIVLAWVLLVGLVPVCALAAVGVDRSLRR